MRTITAEDLVGVWENQNIAPFIKNKDLYITFFVGSLIVNITNEPNNSEPESIASGDFTIEQGENDNFSFVIEDRDEIKTINCRMFMGGNTPRFVATIEPYGEIVMEKQ